VVLLLQLQGQGCGKGHAHMVTTYEQPLPVRECGCAHTHGAARMQVTAIRYNAYCDAKDCGRQGDMAAWMRNSSAHPLLSYSRRSVEAIALGKTFADPDRLATYEVTSLVTEHVPDAMAVARLHTQMPSSAMPLTLRSGILGCLQGLS